MLGKKFYYLNVLGGVGFLNLLMKPLKRNGMMNSLNFLKYLWNKI